MKLFNAIINWFQERYKDLQAKRFAARDEIGQWTPWGIVGALIFLIFALMILRAFAVI